MADLNSWETALSRAADEVVAKRAAFLESPSEKTEAAFFGAVVDHGIETLKAMVQAAREEADEMMGRRKVSHGG